MTTPSYSPPTDIPERLVGLALPALRGPWVDALLSAAGAGGIKAMNASARLLATVEQGPRGSSGAGLDRWGDNLGEPRSGRSDSEYQSAIQTQIAIQRSAGTLPELRTILLELAAPASMVDAYETQGAVMLEAFRSGVALTALQQVSIRSDLESAATAGIRVDPILEVDDATFRFDDDDRGLDAGLLAQSF